MWQTTLLFQIGGRHGHRRTFPIEIQFIAGQIDFIIPAYAITSGVDANLLKKPQLLLKGKKRLPSFEQRFYVINSHLLVFESDKENKICQSFHVLYFMQNHCRVLLSLRYGVGGIG